MSNYPSFHRFDDTPKGTKYAGFDFVQKINGTAVSLAGASITLTLSCGNKLTVGSGLTLSTTVTGGWAIDAQVITFPKGEHDVVVVFTYASGDIKEYINGKWRVT